MLCFISEETFKEDTIMKKKNIVIAVILALMLALGTVLTACILDNQPSGGTNGGTLGNYTTNSELVAMSATSSALILDEMQQNTALAKALNTRDGNSLEGVELTEEEIEEVKAQLAVLENYMGENAIKVEQSAPAEDDEYYGVYEVKMVVSTKNLEGETQSYTMYFNQTETKNEDKVDKDDHFDEDRWEYESEQEFALEGIVISGENVYTMTGRKEVETETEGFETETETSYKMTVSGDNGEYIVFEQSYEEEDGESEQQYEYKIYNNRELVKRFELEFETENNSQEIEMKSYENGQVFRCKYEKKTRNGKDYIEAEVMKDGRMIEVFITVEGSGTEEDPYRHVYTYGEYEDIDD